MDRSEDLTERYHVAAFDDRPEHGEEIEVGCGERRPYVDPIDARIVTDAVCCQGCSIYRESEEYRRARHAVAIPD